LSALAALSGQKHRAHFVSGFGGIWSNLEDKGESMCFSFHFVFLEWRCSLNNRPVAASLKVATKLIIMGVTSCILQSVIGPITAA